MISTYRNTKLVKSHLDPTVDKGTSSEVMRINPAEGVNYQPNIDKEEKIEGKPYMNEKREFQKKFLEGIGKKKHLGPQTDRFTASKSPSQTIDAKKYLDDSIEYSKN